MKRKRLGASSLEVSAMGLGHSMGFQDFSEHGLNEFKQLVHRALELGMNFFDSSDAYWDGLHEEWLRQALGTQRHQAVVTPTPRLKTPWVPCRAWSSKARCAT